jgi:hypothetical protein
MYIRTVSFESEDENLKMRNQRGDTLLDALLVAGRPHCASPSAEPAHRRFVPSDLEGYP